MTLTSILNGIIVVILSEPHTSMTSMCLWVCMFACLLACLLGLTTYRKSLRALILRILHHVDSKGLEDSSQLLTVYCLDGDNKDGDYSWNYLFSV